MGNPYLPSTTKSTHPRAAAPTFSACISITLDELSLFPSKSSPSVWAQNPISSCLLKDFLSVTHPSQALTVFVLLLGHFCVASKHVLDLLSRKVFSLDPEFLSIAKNNRRIFGAQCCQIFPFSLLSTYSNEG